MRLDGKLYARALRLSKFSLKQMICILRGGMVTSWRNWKWHKDKVMTFLSLNWRFMTWLASFESESKEGVKVGDAVRREKGTKRRDNDFIRKCERPWSQNGIEKKKWRSRWSKSGPLACKASALPLSHIPGYINASKMRTVNISTLVFQTIMSVIDNFLEQISS